MTLNLLESSTAFAVPTPNAKRVEHISANPQRIAGLFVNRRLAIEKKGVRL
jgi:hypothetical protein